MNRPKKVQKNAKEKKLMNYGQKIADLRKEKKLTQAELGAKLNITAQAVSKWENNLSEPDINSICRMCEIFEVSVDEFLGIEKKEHSFAQKENYNSQNTVAIKHCEKCKKIVAPNEYVLTHLDLNGTLLNQNQTQNATQHVYCKSCYNSIVETQRQEFLSDTQRQEHIKITNKRIEQEKQYTRQNFKKGLIWGGISAIIAALIFFSSFFASPTSETLFPAIFMTLSVFTLVSELFWDCFVTDFFLFFCHSFSAPFGLIFDLSLDGLIWLLTVKLALWVICGILSILFFLVGIILSLPLSLISFPFVFNKAKNGEL